MNIKKIRHLAKLLDQEGLTELEMQEGDFYLRLKKSNVSPPTESTMGEEVARPVEVQPDDTVVQDVGQVIVSPLSGTFYRAKAPGMPPLVNIGDDVTKGNTLCILEAMKLMNELEAPEDAKIVDVMVDNGQSVTEGQPLFRYIPR
jgi:acetyl-CoA carboxylase biotin carboxyl carrier protein